MESRTGKPLAGRTALVTGSARGLGRMTALELAALGCNVAVNYVRSEADAAELVERLRAAGVRAAAIRADVADPAAPQRLVADVERELGAGVDILVNNAGPFIRERRRFADYAEEEAEALMQGNLLGPMRLDRLVIPGMRERRWGRIVHFGFGRAAEARGWPHRAAYAAAKVGLVSLTKTLAVEEAASGITVNMICPGDIRGAHKEMGIEDVRGLADPESPGQRPGAGGDVARVVAFLCDPASDYVTGNVIEVTGGFDPIRNYIP
ncbi:SDR family oxidoreductase [Paenibacillus sp.]|uniref:SDR family oxidoreductase n=1 Tax=Paenibacillus sp. TaxID=58172 RepID=UPI002810FB66|nr:SDR family oxidoreductase [Paenibacillus sp.]